MVLDYRGVVEARSLVGVFLLQKLGNPIQERYREFEGRPAAMSQLAQLIVHYEKIVTLYNEGVRCSSVTFVHTYLHIICTYNVFVRI